MKYLFLEYPKCSTCRNAKKWLDEHKVAYEDRHIIDQHPSAEELTEWIGPVSYTHLEKVNANPPGIASFSEIYSPVN